MYKMLRKKNITLNGKKADGKEKLTEGDSIRIFFSDETFEKLKGTSSMDIAPGGAKGAKLSQLKGISVIYEDEHILLVDKPVGVLSQKAAPTDVSLNEWLIDYLLKKGDVTEASLETYRPSICNRLDRNTSGIVICAKSLTGARTMNELIRNRDVDKFYRTVCYGQISEGMLLKGFLYKDEKSNKVHITGTDPKDERYSYIETEYTPLMYLPKQDLTLLEIKLITGKPHQIRAHLSSTGHPIIGDIKYGGKKYDTLNHQLLHCCRLVFPGDMKPPFEQISGKAFTANEPSIFKKITDRG